MIKSVLAAAALAVLASTSFAQAASTPAIDKRQTNQEQRINNAESKGTLTTQEQNNLNKREQHISNMETQAKSDGTVTSQERHQIHRAERRTSRAIGRKAHNDRSASASGS
jgi:Spy/CpxP family protein refolding chaperone